MADRSSPVVLRLNGGPTHVRCASNRKYAVVQLVPNTASSKPGNYRPKVLFRSDNPKTIAQRVRQLGGFSWVFDLMTGEQIWSNSASEWYSAEIALSNHASKEV